MKNFKNILLILTILILTGCGLFGPDVSGVWLISGSGNSQVQLQQSGNQIVGIAYYQGQFQGNVYGQIEGSSIIIQISSNYSTPLTYRGIVTSDGNSMQLQTTDGKIISMFRTD